jgi:two-component system, NarL family, response regulator DevR
MQRTRILVVDDHPIVRRGLCTLLGAEPDLEIVGAAGSGEEALELIAQRPADVAVVDVRMPGMSGVDLCRRLRAQAPGTAVLMLSAYLNEDLVREAVHAGARGYLLKDLDEQDLVRGIRSVARGEAAMAPRAAALLVDLLTHGPGGGGITAEELELLRCIARGMTNRALASLLYISENTVKGRVEAVMEGVRRGLL